MKRIAIILGLILVAAGGAWGQADPLNSAYLPSIDTTCGHYPSNIWVTGPLEKVYQNTGTAGTCPGIEGNKWITVYGTQNEIVDFQVHYHDTGAGTAALNAVVSSFVQSSPGSFTIAAPDATHRDIVYYKEGYQVIATPSAVAKTGTPSSLNILTGAGNVPDPLIPAIDPYYHQTTNAFPITVVANQNQSIWVDVHIPSNALSGYYLGSVTLKNGGTTLATLPIIIAVWQWPSAGHMPSTATLQSYHILGDSFCVQFYNTAFGSACGNWPGASGNATTAIVIGKTDFANLMLDHRLSGPNQIYQGPGTSNWNTYTVPLFNGTSNTILSGAHTTAVMWSDDGGTMQQWMTAFQTGGWLSQGPFGYVVGGGCDEPPNGCAWSTIYSNAQTDHALTPPMPQLVTVSFARMTPTIQTSTCGTTTCLTNSVDWMVTNVVDMVNGEWNNIPAYHTYLAGSSNIGTPPARRWWSYQACDATACGTQTSTPGSFYIEGSNYTIDTTGISNRVAPWFEYYAGQQGDLYFNDNICWGTCGSNGGDPLVGTDYNGTWGDGTTVYPGRTTGNPTPYGNVGVTTPIFLPSIRLKNARDGMQDYEYLNVLNANGKGSVASAAIASWMNTSPGGTGVLAWSFNNTQAAVTGLFTSDIIDARSTLGTTMHQLTYSGAVTQTDYYYGQVAAGSNNGSSCANAYALTDATHGIAQSTPWTAGNTLHLCGTFTGTANTTLISAVNSGSSGSPITVKFEPSATLSAPYWGTQGAINTNGKSFIVINGAGTGTISNSANGTSLANQAATTGVYVPGGASVTVQNLNLVNLYVHVGSSTLPNVDGQNSYGIWSIGSNNFSATGNVIHDVRWGILNAAPGGATTHDFTISGNTISNIDHGVVIGDSSTGATVNGTNVINNNVMHDMTNWDNGVNTSTPPGDQMHHDYIHVWMQNGGSGTMTGLQIYNNTFSGDPGFNINSFVYVEQGPSTTITAAKVYNNVATSSSSVHTPPYGMYNIQGTNSYILNNTAIGATTATGSSANACIHIQGTGYTIYNNTCQDLGYLVVIGTSTTTITNIDYNNYFNYNAIAGLGYNGTLYNTLAAWQSACDPTFSSNPCDHNATITNPLIQTSSPWRPQTGSPLIVAGTNLTSLSVTALDSDINGTARAGGSTPWDVGAATSLGSPIPGAPTNLVAGVSGQTVSLSWSPGTGTTVSYNVLRSTTTGGPYTQIATTTTASYADANLAANTYFYVVQGCNAAGCSANSAQVSATVQPAVSIPSAPTSLTATVVNNTQVNLTWTASTGTPTNYQVLRGTSSGGPYTQIANLGVTTAYQDVGLANGTYYYVVTASNTAGTSPNSNQASATIATNPAIQVSPSSVAFGNVLVGSTSPNTIISVANRGTATLSLSSITKGGTNASDFTESTSCTVPGTLAPGAGCTITVSATPSLFGAETANVTIVSNDPTTPTFIIGLSAVGVGGVTDACAGVSPCVSLTFGNLNPHQTSSSQTVTVTNQSGATITFGTIALTTGTQYSLGGTCTSSGTLANNATCTVTVTFAPTSTGTKTDTLTIPWTGAGGSPLTVTMSGSANNHKVKKGVTL